MLPSERRYPDLRDAVLRMEPYVFRVTKRDADELIFPLGLREPRPLTELNANQYRSESGEHAVPPLPLHRHLKAIRKRSRARHTRTNEMRH